MSGSPIQITYAGTDITNHVIFADAVFEQQMNAVPGTCSFRVRDESRSLSFVTGKEIRLFIDGVPMWGGYIRRVGMTYPFAADNTSSPSTYTKRIWKIEGADYNILFDNLITRRTGDYLSLVPSNSGYPVDTMDGWALWSLLHNFSDFPSGFDITATRSDAVNIDDITTVLPAGTTVTKFIYKQQGTKLRDQFDSLAKMAGAVFYIGPEKSVHYHAYETVQKRWGFSDDPNYAAITVSPASYQGADWGFREVTAEEDGSLIVNDAIIWGGSPFGSSGHTLAARYQDETDHVTSGTYTYIQDGAVVADSSIDKHGRWQLGEVHLDGSSGFGTLNGVKARANVIVNGPPGASGDGILKGLRYAQWNFQFSWRAHQVPTLSGTPDHIRAGDIVRINLAAFSVTQFAPARSIRITFDTLDENGDAYALLAGEFSYSYTDPIALWKGIFNAAQNAVPAYVTATTVVTDASTVANFGDSGSFTPVEAPNGTRVLFTLPNGFGYIGGTTAVFLNGLVQRLGTDYAETSPEGGTVTFTSAPYADDTILITCRMLAS